MAPDDFEEYEKEYLERIGLKRDTHEKTIKAASESPLDSWDYAVLEMVRRGDLAIPLKLGTMRATKSFLKLFCHGLVRTLGRKPTFDEVERLQAFFDSPAFSSYKSNLNKVMTKEAEEFFQAVVEITGMKDATRMCELTAKGRNILTGKRAKVLKIYKKMDGQYKLNPADFYEKATNGESYLPIMVAMGLSGPMIGFMLATSDAQYGILNGTATDHVHFEKVAETGFGDSDSELSF